ncbi:hypothetical protein H9Y05_04210 [Crocinitomicaceae bacterium CZZ-1]|uniref:Uncharacterized protein n=1 Tax=Taishania pollutisoli TaxID=2766479 RepID=A0A8J6PNI8_9FLAO|nr:hypothetical protein [Taishania pollutisoli]MBC9811673.1 hypothetical protein [Taishania pollutisoli]MBX2948392.1 hypothetical protein [Crocinitomicaceae bacterium]NGF75490.1 hypothetical protein [Fluviicola sp. SGL-29]
MKTMIKTSSLIIFSFSLQSALCQEVTRTPERTIHKEIRSVQETKENAASISNSSQTNHQSEQTYSVDRYGVQRQHDKAYYQEKLAELDELVQAIDVKVDYVNSNPEERAKATENGWFRDMETTKERLRNERVELVRKIESF